MENLGAHATILCFAFNKNTRKLSERSIHSLLWFTQQIFTEHYVADMDLGTGGFSEYKTDKKQKQKSSYNQGAYIPWQVEINM